MIRKSIRIWMIICASILYIDVQCQDTTAFIGQVIKFESLSLISLFPTCQFAYEHRIGSSLTMQVGAGYVTDFFNRDDHYTSKRGLKFKEELRYYLSYISKPRWKNYRKGTYLGFEMHQTMINFNEYEDRVRWREYGYGAKLGFAEFSRRIMLDYSIGISFRHLNMEPVDTWGFYSNTRHGEGKYLVVAPMLRFGVGYVIK